MATYLVTRHEGTRLWVTAAARKGRLPFEIDHVVEHLDPSRLAKGDVVVGTLPIAIAAELEARKIEFWALDLDLPPEERGKELGGVRLLKLYENRGARFTRYQIRRKDSVDVEGKASRARPAQPAISFVPVSDQLAPGAIGWLHQPTAQVCLLASPAMRKRAEILSAWLRGRAQPPEVEIRDWDDRDYATLLAQADEWAGKLALEDRPAVAVHLTGGTKPMAMALQRVFGKRGEAFGGRLSGPYVDTGHGRIEDLLAPVAAATPMPMRSVLNIGDLLALNGIEITEPPTSARPGYRAWFDRIALFDLLRHERARQTWLSLWYAVLQSIKDVLENKKARDRERAASVTRVGGSSERKFRVEVDPKRGDWKFLRGALDGPLGRKLAECGAAEVALDPACDRVFTLAIGTKDKGLDELDFLSGTWFEVWLARQFAAAGVDDWAQGLEIKQGKAKNELDLVVANGNRSLLVEVKTSALDKPGKEDSKAAETVYKLDSVAAKLGRFFNDRWLVSLRDQKLRDADRERAEGSGIRVFEGDDVKEIPRAIRQWVDDTRLERDDAFRPAFARADAKRAPRAR